MKKSIFNKMIAGIVLGSVILVGASDANAQRRTERNEKYSYEHRNHANQLREDDRRSRYNESDYRNHKNRSYQARKAQNIAEIKRKQKKHNQHKYKKFKQREFYARGYNKAYHPHYKVHKYYNHPHHRYRHYYNQFGHDVYYHSKFGNVVWRFAYRPVVIHHEYGDFFYSDGYYYQFYPKIGYVEVDPPRSLYFSYLPDDCCRVAYRGNVYYTDGELCFVKRGRGFKLVKAPGGIHFSLRF